jgi:hypothetical protein
MRISIPGRIATQLAATGAGGFWRTFGMLLAILVLVVGHGAEELLKTAPWSSTRVRPVLGEPDDVGAVGGEDVLDVGLREPAVSAVA